MKRGLKVMHRSVYDQARMPTLKRFPDEEGTES